MLSRLLCSSNTLCAYLMPGKHFVKVMTHVLANVDGMNKKKQKSVFGPLNQLKRLKKKILFISFGVPPDIRHNLRS